MVARVVLDDRDRPRITTGIDLGQSGQPTKNAGVDGQVQGFEKLLRGGSQSCFKHPDEEHRCSGVLDEQLIANSRGR